MDSTMHMPMNSPLLLQWILQTCTHRQGQSILHLPMESQMACPMEPAMDSPLNFLMEKAMGITKRFHCVFKCMIWFSQGRMAGHILLKP